MERKEHWESDRLVGEAPAPPTLHAPRSTLHARRIRLTVAYDGTDFYGAQVQARGRTVGGELEVALGRLAGEPVRVTFAGRTDRGVHADGQVAHCDIATRLDDARLQRALNALLPNDVAVLRLATAADDFHARHDARWREYRYRLWHAPVRVPGLARTTWHLTRSLDRRALDEAAGLLVGEHDFAAFAGQGLGVPDREDRPVTVRAVYEAAWSWSEPLVSEPFGQVGELRIRGSGFLPQMVRTIVAALVEVGSGRREPSWIAELLAARDRSLAPSPAPPRGLILWAVGYGGSGQRSAVSNQLRPAGDEAQLDDSDRGRIAEG